MIHHVSNIWFVVLIDGLFFTVQTISFYPLFSIMVCILLFLSMDWFSRENLRQKSELFAREDYCFFSCFFPNKPIHWNSHLPSPSPVSLVCFSNTFPIEYDSVSQNPLCFPVKNGCFRWTLFTNLPIQSPFSYGVPMVWKARHHLPGRRDSHVRSSRVGS